MIHTTKHPYRAQLGLAIHGPFNRNHRRKAHRRYTRLREYANHLLCAVLLVALAAYATALFS